MARTSTRRSTRRTTLHTGPFCGVQSTRDPYDDNYTTMVDAINGYIPDPKGGSSFYSRPGMQLQNKLTPFSGHGQSVYTHVALDGTIYNFLVADGKLYRGNVSLTSYVDVTPTSGIVIDPDVRRVYFLTFNDFLIISDGVHPPWVASNLNAAHISGTYIDIDGSGTPWAAYGQPVDYAGSVFFIIDNVDGVQARTDIVWSAPGDPTLGYQQNPYDFRWTLVQTGQGALYAIWGTNVALYYFRADSIGTIAGIPGPDLQQTHTADAIAQNVGCTQSATIVQFGNTIHFCDANGRPWMMAVGGGAPEAIWLQMREVVYTSTYDYPTITAQVACAVVEPTLNLVLFAIWSPTPGELHAPNQLIAFDARSGTYVGRWIIGRGAQVEAMGILNNTYGSGSLAIIGTAPAAGGNGIGLATESDVLLTTEDFVVLGVVDQITPRTGIVWSMSRPIGGGDPLLTQAGDTLVTMGGDTLTTESTYPSWKDDDAVPIIAIKTQRLGYNAQAVWNFDMVNVITEGGAPCQIRMTSSTTLDTLEATPSPSSSLDQTNRLVAGCTAQGRGVEITVQPTTADDQWSCQRVEALAIPSLASWQEP